MANKRDYKDTCNQHRQWARNADTDKFYIDSGDQDFKAVVIAFEHEAYRAAYKKLVNRKREQKDTE